MTYLQKLTNLNLDNKFYLINLSNGLEIKVIIILDSHFKNSTVQLCTINMSMFIYINKVYY